RCASVSFLPTGSQAQLIGAGRNRAPNRWPVIMNRGMVVVYFSRLGGRLRHDQKLVLDANAQALAKLKAYDFGGHHEAAHDYSGPLFFVPDDTLLVEEASSLGIRAASDLYGGIVSHP